MSKKGLGLAITS
jgi:hypothetical protein